LLKEGDVDIDAIRRIPIAQGELPRAVEYPNNRAVVLLHDRSTHSSPEQLTQRAE